MVGPTTLLVSLIGLAAASPLTESHQKRACGETGELVCYTQSQKLKKADIKYAASYLRYLASNSDTGLWTMPSGFGCEEWRLPLFGAETVLGLAKHINPRTNSSVAFTDIARTLDGGENPTEEQGANSLLGKCGVKGGQVRVKVTQKNPAYHTPEYIESGAKPKDIIIKLVRDPDFQG